MLRPHHQFPSSLHRYCARVTFFEFQLGRDNSIVENEYDQHFAGATIDELIRSIIHHMAGGYIQLLEVVAIFDDDNHVNAKELQRFCDRLKFTSGVG